MAKKVVFVDRDGTLIREPTDFQVDSLEKIDFLPGVIRALYNLRKAGYELVIVTNQDGLGTKDFPREGFERAHKKILQIFEGEGITFDAQFIDEHYASEDHPNRKPNTGAVAPYFAQNDIDKAASYMIGDRKTDALFAKRLGIHSITIKDAKSNDGDQRISVELPEEIPTTTYTSWDKIVEHILHKTPVNA